MIKEAYCSFEVAKLLKEKGYPQTSDRCHYIINENGNYYRCFEDRCGFGDYDIIAPTHQIAMAWLRDKGFLLWVYPAICLNAEDNHTFHWMWDGKKQRHDAPHFGDKRSYNTYEKAEEAALKYCLEQLIKK